MKCVCGYEHESGIDDTGKYQQFLIGDEKFKYLNPQIFKVNEGYMESKDIHLYVCPKCGTVRAETRCY